MKSYNGIYMLFLATLMACCNRPLERDAYISWVTSERSGLRDILTNGDYFFDVQYQPAEMVYLQRYSESNASEEERDAALAEISTLQYYTLTVGMIDNSVDFIQSGTSGPEERQAKIYYFSYPFQEDIALIEGGEKRSPVLFHFERSMDMKNRRTFVMGFEKPIDGEGETSFIIDSHFFGPESIVLTINKQDIKKLKQ